jgi:hypothetical protein
MSTQRIITLNSVHGRGKPSNFTFFLKEPLRLDDSGKYNYTVSLHNAAIYYSIPNVSEPLGNNQINIWYRGWVTIHIEDRMIMDYKFLNAMISQKLYGIFPNDPYMLFYDDPKSSEKKCRIWFEPNDMINRFVLRIKQFYDNPTDADTIKIDFSAGKSAKFGKMLGFDPAVYKVDNTTAQHGANMENNVNTLHIRTNLVSDSFTTDKDGNIINCADLFVFSPYGRPNTLMTVAAGLQMSAIPLNTRYINTITIQITDDDGNDVDLREHCIISLLLNKTVAI